LGGTASFAIRNGIREVQSQNVLAKLEGSVWPDEYVIYSAHWDHLGKDESLSGDNIFNGALDNASGTSQMLEIAEAFTKLPERPARSILFLAVTAEEKGLLGAKYYAENPLYPLTETVANVNMDGVNQWGRTRDIVVIGLGNSTLDDVLAEAAATQGRQLTPDAEPEKGFYYRSDHFEFAKQGVPALYTDEGVDFIDKPAGYSKQKRDEYTNVDYHKVSDHIKPDWDLAGAVEDAQLLFQVGYRVSQRRAFPEWKPGTEFKALRDDMLAGRR
jgi:Zn-dependent M28 family amino/carboxypeptidase